MFKKSTDVKLLPSSSELYKNRNKQGKNIPFSILGSQSFFEGKLSLKGETRIAGHIEGNIFAQDLLIIEDGARIVGSIRAKNLEICGFVHGTIHVSEILRITSTATIEGEVYAFKLIVEEGARIHGRIVSSIAEEHTPVSENEPLVETGT